MNCVSGAVAGSNLMMLMTDASSGRKREFTGDELDYTEGDLQPRPPASQNNPSKSQMQAR